MLMEKVGEANPTTTTEIDRPERMFDMWEQCKGGKPKERNLEMGPQYHTLSKALNILRATA